MNEYISEGYTIQRLSTLTLEQIIYGTKRFTNVAQNEYFDIYCTFKETVDVSQKLFKSAKSNYLDLKSSVEKDTRNSGESIDLKVKAYNAKNSLLTSIIQSYAGVKFVFKPLLSSFIHILLKSHIKERDKIQYAIHDEIQKILEETEKFTNLEEDSQSLRTKIERDQSFEVLVLQELTCYHIRLQNTARIWIVIATVLNILFVVVVILFGIRYLVFYIRARIHAIRQRQPILTYQEATSRSIN
ncbi:hypothetical protein RF11_05086 [Thelohanellus kitauei]|uniref:Uncharacterized protein n=1 Tax=Thelohanellus kitauei TaxID=669202 RepID=A0A0C2J823_THEKT|nr:hypothetical protein RF11_05086 [Thelohanellus kitauei]